MREEGGERRAKSAGRRAQGAERRAKRRLKTKDKRQKFEVRSPKPFPLRSVP